MVEFQSLSVFLILTVTLFTLAGAIQLRVNGTDGRTYLIETDENYNWYQALHACARKNMQLAQIESGEKNLVVLRLLKTYLGNSRDLWIGANDECSKSKVRPFYWTSSGRTMTYSYWNHDQPDNRASVEHCVHTWKLAEDFKWNDADCTYRLGYLCEQKY